MSHADEIRQELEKKNRQARQNVKREKDNQEFQEYLDDLGIDRIDNPTKDKTQSGRRSRK